MKFILYMELGIRNVELSSDLLLFPDENRLPDNQEWTAKWWGQGRTRILRSRNRGPILYRLCSERFNELELRFQTKGSLRQGPDAKIVRGWLQMYPSPSSILWATVSGEKLTTPIEERRRKQFVTAEDPKWRGRFRRPYPSVLECSELEIEVCTDVSGDEDLQSIAVGLIADAMPSSLTSQDIFGYGCLRGSCRKQMMLANLGDVPEAVDLLGDKFEDIYPILIGRTALCKELASRLDGLGKVVQLGADKFNSILSITPSEVQKARAVAWNEGYIIDIKTLADNYRQRLIQEKF